LGKAVVDDVKVARLTQWSFDPSVGDTEWGDSDGEGYTMVKAGRKGGTGSVEGKFDTSKPQYAVFEIGDEVELTLWMDATRYFAIPCAVITGFSLVVNVDSQEVVGWTASFKASGKYYYPGQSGAPTETMPS
jgi:hypothetical protein